MSVRGDGRQRAAESGDASLCQHRSYRVAVPGVQRLDRVGHCVHAGDDRQASRHVERQLNVVDDDARQYLGRAQSRLSPLLCLSQDGGRFRPCVGRRNGNLWQAGAQRQRLAEAGRRTAAERYQAIGRRRGQPFQDPLSHFDRRVHGRVRGKTHGAIAEQLENFSRGRLCVMRVGQDEGAAAAQPAHFICDARERALTEDHPAWQRRVVKGVHDLRSAGGSAKLFDHPLAHLEFLNLASDRRREALHHADVAGYFVV